MTFTQKVELLDLVKEYGTSMRLYKESELQDNGLGEFWHNVNQEDYSKIVALLETL